MSQGTSAQLIKDLFASIAPQKQAAPTSYNASESTPADYQSLFENAVCGIYRDRLDGTPVRANRALYAFNGYSSEAEHLAAVTRHGGSWYVDSDRPKLFQHLMETQGFVRDLVSEVYRHRTRERAWITENAWYVYDSSGMPVYIEGTIQDATDRVVAMAEVERQANTDLLTGAANRFSFLKFLHDHVANAAVLPCALLIVDLDKFKEINDLFGHSAGDLVLRLTVRRLKDATAGRSAIVARLGGDEFAILLHGRTYEDDARTVAEAVVGSMRLPIDIEGHDMFIGASVGVALCPTHTQSAKELLSFADLALYQRKHNGRNGYCVFSDDLQARHKQRMDLERELNAAIEADALELFYQPVVSSQSGRITGSEALMRWRHPVKGLIPPGEFIPLAEEAGLMVALGDWAILRACRQAVQMPAPIKVAVNVSPSQLRSAGIVDTVRRALADTGMAPDRLILEITETAILSSEALVGGVVADLRALGVGLALDDFGTGYSSLSYLQKYPFTEIKIDRSFIANIANGSINAAIIRGVLAIARDMKFDVVAEGVETEEQVAFLRGEQCEYLQGYYFSKPKPFAEFCQDLAVKSLRDVSRNLLTQAPPHTRPLRAGLLSKTGK